VKFRLIAALTAAAAVALVPSTVLAQRQPFETERPRLKIVSLARQVGSSLRVFAPVPARMARRAGFERAHILVQSAVAGPLQDFLSRWRAWIVDNAPRNVRWSIDVESSMSESWDVLNEDVAGS